MERSRPRSGNVPSCSLVVDNIPAEFCNEEAVRGHFSKFGTLEMVEILENFALIKYSTLEEAKICHSSPEVIFNNRFVKVYWQPLEVAQKLQEMQDAEKIAKQKAMESINRRRAELLSKQVAELESINKQLKDESLDSEKRNELQLKSESLASSIETKKNQIAASEQPVHRDNNDNAATDGPDSK